MFALRNVWRSGGEYKPRRQGVKQERMRRSEDEEKKGAESKEEKTNEVESKEEETEREEQTNEVESKEEETKREEKTNEVESKEEETKREEKTNVVESKEEETKREEKEATGIEDADAGAAFAVPLGMNVGPSLKDDYSELGDPTPTWDCSFVRLATRRDGLISSVKMVKREHINEIGRRRLRNEARLLHEMDSPHIIKLHGYYEESDAFYMAVEYCKGGELFERTANQREYTEGQARDVVKQLLEAMAYLHERGVVVSNLLPQHLQLSDNSSNAVLKITSLEKAVKSSMYLDPGEDLGVAPEYSAPEVVKFKPCTMAADIWRVGVITYILVGGYLPFSGKTQVALLANIKSGQITFGENWGSAAFAVQDFIKSMLERVPEKRITAADALKHDWMTLAGGDLEAKHLLPALDRFRRMNAKRKFKHVVFCAAHLVYGLQIALDDEETARAYQVAEHFVYELGLVKGPASNSETSPGSPGQGLSSSPSVQALFGPYLRYTLVKALKQEPEPETYNAPDYGVRLVVPVGVGPLPKPIGPILLQEAADVIQSQGQSFFLTTIVMCAAHGVHFSPPLQLDFQLEPGESLSQAKDNFNRGQYQVFHRDHEDSIWIPIPRSELTVDVSREGLTKTKNILQAKVKHFSMFAFGKCVDIEGGGIILENQKDKKTVIVKNSCDVSVQVVSQPTSAMGRIRRGVAFGLHVLGRGGEVGSDRGSTSSYFRAAGTPSFASITTRATYQFDVLGGKATVRLLFATREDAESRDGERMFTLKLWGSVGARGGRRVRLVKSLLEGDAQNEVDLPVRGTNVKSAILELDGTPQNETTAQTPVSQEDQGGSEES